MSPRPSRDLELLGLTAVAAITDAMSYLGLDHVFAANMTGNTVLVAIGVATGDLAAAGRSVTALAAFLAGALLAGTLGARAPRRLPAAVIGPEAACLVAGGCVWAFAGVHPVGAARLAAIALFAAAMGLQSGLLAQRGAGLSTTYLTGMWTTVSTSIARRVTAEPAPQQPDRLPIRLAILVCYFGVALAAAAVYHALG